MVSGVVAERGWYKWETVTTRVIFTTLRAYIQHNLMTCTLKALKLFSLNFFSPGLKMAMNTHNILYLMVRFHVRYRRNRSPYMRQLPENLGAQDFHQKYSEFCHFSAPMEGVHLPVMLLKFKAIIFSVRFQKLPNDPCLHFYSLPFYLPHCGQKDISILKISINDFQLSPQRK